MERVDAAGQQRQQTSRLDQYLARIKELASNVLENAPRTVRGVGNPTTGQDDSNSCTSTAAILIYWLTHKEGMRLSTLPMMVGERLSRPYTKLTNVFDFVDTAAQLPSIEGARLPPVSAAQLPPEQGAMLPPSHPQAQQPTADLGQPPQTKVVSSPSRDGHAQLPPDQDALLLFSTAPHKFAVLVIAAANNGGKLDAALLHSNQWEDAARQTSSMQCETFDLHTYLSGKTTTGVVRMDEGSLKEFIQDLQEALKDKLFDHQDICGKWFDIRFKKGDPADYWFRVCSPLKEPSDVVKMC